MTVAENYRRKLTVRKMDRNGYNPSILDTCDGEDYLTKDECLQTVRHEIYFGTANRKISKVNGLWVNVSPESHRLIHSNRQVDLRLKVECQMIFECEHSREEFRALIGKSYL